MTKCAHMRAKPVPPTSEQILNYKVTHDCGIFSARDRMSQDYQAELSQWILDMIDHLVEVTHQ